MAFERFNVDIARGVRKAVIFALMCRIRYESLR